MTERRFLKIPMFVWDGLSGLAGLTGICALLLGSIFATLEYQDRKASARAAETLNLIEIWEVRGAQDSYRQISSLLEAALQGRPSGQTMSAGEFTNFKRNLIRRVMMQSGSGNYENVVSFFTRLSLCVQAHLCSDRIADVFFFQTMADFRAWFDPEILRRRGLSPGHGKELDWLVCHLAATSADSTAPDVLTC